MAYYTDVCQCLLCQVWISNKFYYFFQYKPLGMLELLQGNVDNVEHIGCFFSLAYIFRKRK